MPFQGPKSHLALPGYVEDPPSSCSGGLQGTEIANSHQRTPAGRPACLVFAEDVALLLSLCSQVFLERGILERKLLLFVFLSDVALPGSFMEDIGNASYICNCSNGQF